jgi:Mrp family chromosome partitioning ATPase
MRHPTAHRLFGMPRGPGFSEVLKGEADPLDVVQPTPVARLSLIPAGEFSLAAVQSLGHEVQNALFEKLKQHFDVIVLDTCPVLPVADTLHLAQHVDGVIFSMLRRVSQMPKVSAALHRLRQVGTPVLGAIVNGTDEDVYGSRYYAEAPAQV